VSEVPEEDSIDSIVAKARARIGKAPSGTLPQMSSSEMLGTQASPKSFGSYEEMEAQQSRRDLPSPEENVKTLGDLMAKYRIGDDPDFKVLLYRAWPKFFANNVIAEGYYASYDQPITEETIAEEFGGGHYRLMVHGPRPNSVHGTKHYASHMVKIAGEPRTDRVPNRGAVGATPTQGSLPGRTESEGMGERAFSTLHTMFNGEREERRELEQRQFDQMRAAQDSAAGMTTVYERLMNDRLASERAAHERERSLIERQQQERQDRVAEQERRYEQERRSMPDPFDQITKAASLFKGDGGESQQRVLDSVLTKHREEVQSLRDETARSMDRVGQANAQETAAIREASRREVEAERNASQSREKDLLRQIEHERDERRRDQDRYREDLANREQAAKDRLDQARETLGMQWQARYDTLGSQNDLRMTYLRDDLERKGHELDELRTTAREDKDPISAMRRMRDFQDTAKDILGISDSTSRGIGSETPAAPAGFDFNKVFEAVAEKGPQYLEALGGLLNRPQTAQQAPPQPGQILQTPQGVFQVVQTANGLGMIPYTPPQAVPVPTRLAGPPQRRALPAQQPVAMPDVDDVIEATTPPPRTPRAPTPRPKTVAQPTPVPVQAAGKPRIAEKPPQPTAEAPQIPDAVKKQIAATIAGFLDTSIKQGDEPEDLLAVMSEKYPAEWLKMLATIDIEEILGQIREVQPNAAVFTPGGMNFTYAVFRQLRALTA